MPGREPAEDGAARLRVLQRRDVPVPGSGGKLRVHLSDITRGQVEVTIGRENGESVLATTSMREGDSARFLYEGHPYRLRMIRLENFLLGEDVAELGVSEDVPPPSDPRALIERLLVAVRLSDVVFVRNGAEHGPGEAAGHLKGKWIAAGDAVRTPEDFIRACESRSSLSGEAYLVRFRDGSELTSESWLLSNLDALRAESK